MNQKQFFDMETLKSGSDSIIKSITQQYLILGEKKVFPQVEPGYLRKQFPQFAPRKGKDIESIIKETEDKILPGALFFHSPKYFGFFSPSVSTTSVLAEMYATAFHSPAFLYMLSPSYTELQKIIVDWCVHLIGLPDKFLFKNTGGGIINPSATQSLFTVVHAAKIKKVTELGIQLSNPKMLKFVGYYSDFCHKSAQKALILKDIAHRHVIPSVYNKQKLNFEICPQKLEQIIKKDIADGLIPFFFGGQFGSTLTCAIDLNEEVISLVKKYGMWLSVDAVYLGSSWIVKKNQPQEGFFDKADSIMINFSKNLLVGNGGSLLFVADRKQFQQSISKKTDASYYKNDYSEEYEVTDYMDWTVGLDRRLNVFKFYFLFEHYGVDKLQTLIINIQEKARIFRQWVQESEVLQIFSHKYGLVTLQVKDPITNEASNELTQKVMYETQNTQNGYCTPGQFYNNRFIRFNFGNYMSCIEEMKVKFDQVQKSAINHRQSRLFQKQNKLQLNELQQNQTQKKIITLKTYQSDKQFINS